MNIPIIEIKHIEEAQGVCCDCSCAFFGEEDSRGCCLARWNSLVAIRLGLGDVPGPGCPGPGKYKLVKLEE